MTGRGRGGGKRRLSPVQFGLLAALAILLCLLVAWAAALVSGRLSLPAGQPRPERPLPSGTAAGGGALSSPTVQTTATPSGAATIALPTRRASATATAPPTKIPPTVTDVLTPTVSLTPEAGACSRLDLTFLSATSNLARWRLRNDSGRDLEITRIQMDWPPENDAVFNAFVGGTVIWSGEDLVAPTILTEWVGEAEARTVQAVATVEFLFGTTAAAQGYDLHIWFANGCEATDSR